MTHRMTGAIVAALVLAPAALAAQKEVPFSWSGTLAAGRELEVKGINGDVEVTGVSGRTVTIKAVKRGVKSDPAEVEVRVVPDGDGLEACVVYPGNHGTGCDTKGSVNENDVTVHFTVQVPADVRLDASTVNGAVRAKGLQADAEAHSVNGDVTVVTSGIAEASTVNGDVRLELGRATWKGEVEATTVNGSVTVVMPEPKHLTITATSTNGEFESDFPITMTGKVTRNRVHGTIGQGGPELDLKSVNGSIALRRAK